MKAACFDRLHASAWPRHERAILHSTEKRGVKWRREWSDDASSKPLTLSVKLQDMTSPVSWMKSLIVCFRRIGKEKKQGLMVDNKMSKEECEPFLETTIFDVIFNEKPLRNLINCIPWQGLGDKLHHIEIAIKCMSKTHYGWPYQCITQQK